MGRVIDNPRTGERIVISQSSGDVLEFDLFLQPGGHVPAGHVHPRQEERFSVIDGRMRFRVGRHTILAGPGDTLLVPQGTPHWFGNCGPSVARLKVEVRPALRMRELFETSVARDSQRGWWTRLEPSPGCFAPDELDWQIDTAERAGKQIIVCVGALKTFGYPEFFVPSHRLAEPLLEGIVVRPAQYPRLLDAATEFATRIAE